MSQGSGRFREIDFLRGIAIILMVAYHFLFDLRYLGRLSFDVDPAFWFYAPRAIASLFLLLVGVSLSLSRSRALRSGGSAGLFLRYLKRGVGILFWAFVITLATWIYAPQEYIIFGILHLIGFSIILAYPLLGYRYANLFLGVCMIILGVWVDGVSVDHPYFLWLGFFPKGLATLDYFPLLPWLGVVLVGVFIGNSVYPGYARAFKLGPVPSINSGPVDRFAGFVSGLGRRSLLVYLVHQPVLVGIIMLFW